LAPWPRRLQSIAGVGGLHPSHNPEIAAHRRRVLREAFAPLVCEPQARHTTWREVVARTHSIAQCHRLCIYAAFRRVIEGSEVRDGLLKPITPISARSATLLAE
jgi:hypothetical protein